MGTKSSKRYVVCNISDNPQLLSRGYYDTYEIPQDVLSKIVKDAGISYDIYHTVGSISLEVADSLISSLVKKSDHKEIALLLDDETHLVVGYSLEAPRIPVLNSDFITRAESIAEANAFVTLSDKYYTPDDTISSVIYRRNDPIIIEEKYLTTTKSIEYNIGLLVVNDELNSSYSRLVVYIDGQPLYLPPSYYSASSARYRRSTGSSSEALEVLLLKVIDDLRDEALKEKIYEFHYKYRANKEIVTSYEEYNRVISTMRKIPTIIEDNSFLESLLSRYENFERRYSRLDDQKSSYIWRCTALSDITIGSLVSLTSKILSEIGAPAAEYFNIRDLLGSYLCTSRIAVEIAREDIE